MPDNRSLATNNLAPRRALLAALAAVLVVAIGLIIYGETRPLERTFYGSVKDLLPKPEEMPGWTVQYLPLADTPEAQAKVAETLQYDDAVYAVYTRGAERISIYLAYWQPGKMSPRLIAGHTPDVCWVNAGWKPVARGQWTEGRGPRTEGGEQSTVRKGRTSETRDQAHAESAIVRKLSAHLPGLARTPGQYRVFEQDGHTEHVVFWHEVGGRTVSYGERPLPVWHAPIADMLRWGFAQCQEQFFIRFSGPCPAAEWPESIASTLIVERLFASFHRSTVKT